MAAEAGIAAERLPEGIRTRRLGDVCFAFNYGGEERVLPTADEARLVLGKAAMPPAGVTAWLSL